MSADAELVGVVPAAGHAARLQPLRGSKEVLRVGGRPVIEHIVERMRRAGCADIRVVTRPEKVDVIEYAQRADLAVVLARPPSVSASLLAGLQGTDPASLALVGFPDTIWEPPNGFVHVLEGLQGFDAALGLFPGEEAERSDVVEVTPAGIVRAVHVKPAISPSSWIWGCAVARRWALDALTADPEPGRVFDAMSREGGVVAVKLSGPFLDIGTSEALASVVSQIEPKEDTAETN
jgi:glucose-1-phosphate thymidylyltransferase